eukprot:3628546-Pyramimonas_sp.AAC.1
MEAGHGEDPTDVIDHIMKDAERNIWAKASRHHNGKGLEHGADFTDVKKADQHANEEREVQGIRGPARGGLWRYLDWSEKGRGIRGYRNMQ